MTDKPQKIIQTSEQLAQLTREIDQLRHEHPELAPRLPVFERLPEPTPYQRGVLDRYQDRGPRRRRFHR